MEDIAALIEAGKVEEAQEAIAAGRRNLALTGSEARRLGALLEAKKQGTQAKARRQVGTGKERK